MQLNLNHMGIAMLLIDTGAKVQYDDYVGEKNSPMYSSLRGKNKKAIKLFIDNGKIDFSGWEFGLQSLLTSGNIY